MFSNLDLSPKVKCTWKRSSGFDLRLIMKRVTGRALNTPSWIAIMLFAWHWCLHQSKQPLSPFTRLFTLDFSPQTHIFFSQMVPITYTLFHLEQNTSYKYFLSEFKYVGTSHPQLPCATQCDLVWTHSTPPLLLLFPTFLQNHG